MRSSRDWPAPAGPGGQRLRPAPVVRQCLPALRGSFAVIDEELNERPIRPGQAINRTVRPLLWYIPCP